MKHSGYTYSNIDGLPARQVPLPYAVPLLSSGHATTRNTSEHGPSQVFGEILPSSVVKRKDHVHAYPDLRTPGLVEAALRRASGHATTLTLGSGIHWNFRELPTMTLDRAIPVSLCLNMPDPLAFQSIVSNTLKDYRGRNCGLWVTLADDDQRKVLSLAVAPERTDNVFVFWGFCSPLIHVNILKAMQKLDMVPCMPKKRVPFYGIQFVRMCKFVAWDSRQGTFRYRAYHHILGYQPSDPPPSKEYTREHVQCAAISAKAALLVLEQMGFQSPSMSKEQREWMENQDREYLQKNPEILELFASPKQQGEIHNLEQLHAVVVCPPHLDVEECNDEEVMEEKNPCRLMTSGQTAASCGAVGFGSSLHAASARKIDVGEWSDEEAIESVVGDRNDLGDWSDEEQRRQQSKLRTPPVAEARVSEETPEGRRDSQGDIPTRPIRVKTPPAVEAGGTQASEGRSGFFPGAEARVGEQTSLYVETANEDALLCLLKALPQPPFALRPCIEAGTRRSLKHYYVGFRGKSAADAALMVLRGKGFLAAGTMIDPVKGWLRVGETAPCLCLSNLTESTTPDELLARISAVNPRTVVEVGTLMMYGGEAHVPKRWHVYVHFQDLRQCEDFFAKCRAEGLFREVQITRSLRTRESAFEPGLQIRGTWQA